VGAHCSDLYPVTAMRCAVFLDRDGVLNRAVVCDGKPYSPATLDELEILPGVTSAPAGCLTIFIDRGYNERLVEASDAVCADLAAAAAPILHAPDRSPLRGGSR
jgi:hypothetical protein